MWTVRVTVILGEGRGDGGGRGRAEKGAREGRGGGVNVRRGADNDERGTDFNYGICAGETLNFPAGTCPSPFSIPFPFSSLSSPGRLFLPL